MGTSGSGASDGLTTTLEWFVSDDANTPRTVEEVAASLDCSPETARERLESLERRGDLDSKVVGEETRLWWRPPDDQGRTWDRHRKILETMQDGVYAVDPDGYFTMVNDAYVELTGYSRSELLGSHASKVVDEETIERANDRETDLRAGTKETAMITADINTASGETVQAEATFSLLSDTDGVYERVGVVRDVSARIERERELEQYERIVETVDDGVYAVDDDGRFILANRAFCEMTGWDRDELLGRHAAAVYDDELTPEVEELEAQIHRGEQETATLELELHTSDGDRVPVESRFQEFPTGDGQGRCGIVRDITRRKREENQLRTLNETAKAFLRATTKEEVSEVIVEAAVNVLDVPGVGVYRYDECSDELYPGMASMAEGLMRDSLPRIPADDSTLTGHVFEGGEPRRFENILDVEYNDASTEETEMRGGVFVPMGDHGVLICGSREVDAFDEHLQHLIELLAANAEAAYESVERERELHEYERIVETVDDGVYVLDEAARFQRVNDAMVSMTRFDRAELLGSHASLVFGEKFDDIDAEAHDLFEDDGQDVAVFEERLHTAEQATITVESRFKQFDVEGGRGRVGVVRDITDRKEYEEDLETRARQQEAVSRLGRYALEQPDLDDLFQMASDLVTDVLDVDYCKVLDLDEDAEELLLRQGVGWRDGIVGEATVSAVEDDSQASYTLRTSGPVVVEDMATETRFSGPDLLTSHDVSSGISTVIGPYDDPWGILGTHDTEQRSYGDEDVTFVQSVSALLATAIERHTYRQEREEMVDALAESNERLEHFAYITSHDLQEPLRMVSNYLQLVESRYADDLDEDGQEFIEFAVDGANRMRDMVDDLLAYSRIDTEAESFEPTDTEAVVDRALQNLEMQIQDEDATVTVGSLPTVQADANQLEQVFQNLVSNALKYRHDERDPEVTIDASREGDEWVFAVEDNGIGIDPDMHDRIFEVFERLHTHDEYSGTGIGLALCQRIIDRHDGQIWVESDRDEGSTFKFTIPADGDLQ
ncbi:PAS domain S-box protein [Haloarchaeobius amylolyticus]|uniref:PAS domain S-box protein n=1 Tax=Haloarchaeobius amylolyticus TaxID=1198296 RepID=UPI00226E8494|nr:PAS domain S-box protein [Haloarchaeobius amylolyticus]